MKVLTLCLLLILTGCTIDTPQTPNNQIPPNVTPGEDNAPEDENLSLYLSMKPGGFIMFGRDFTDKTKEQVINNINYYQENSDIPMIIGVDEEGGSFYQQYQKEIYQKTGLMNPY